MIDSNYRTPYQRLIIEPLLKKAFLKGISPLTVTLIGVASGIFIPLFLYFHQSIAALAFLGISGFCDTLDGSLARHKDLSSPSGAVLDIVADRLVEWAILLGLFLYAPESRGLMTIWMLGSVLLCITTFLVVGIFQKNASEKSFHYSPGLIERAEAFIFFSLMILFPNFFTLLALLFGGLTLLTAIIRIKQFNKT
ncbi:MAG: CDP-alcohol phosphatidyltransferase family protein [Simkaniaceae bacterium]|nr:MAG: CDP-alcohol phosphatidyltransferase family protein [Simkaniaceae bacterium]